MIKAVAQAIPAYAMSVFKLPQSVCQDLNSILSRFWWGSQEDKKGIHWMKWELLCDKKEDGGLGFRKLEWFNQALLAKMGWKVIQNEESLVHKVLRSK